MSKAEFKVEGLSDIDRALTGLPLATGKSVLRRVATRRLEPMRDRAEELAPEHEGELKGSLAISSRQKTGGARRRSYEGKGTVEVHMGPTSDGYPQAIPQEFGWTDTAGNDHPGQPYMRPAWDEGHRKLLDGITEDLGDEVDKAAKRAARKAARRRAKG